MKRIMKKLNFLTVLLLVLSITPVLAEGSIQFQSYKKPSLIINRDYPQIYRPVKLFIGKENKFTVKAEAGSFVSIALSLADKGADIFYGHELRLGKEILATGEGKTAENGLAEITVKIPDDKKLKDKPVYFEAAVWKNEDFSDLKIAQIISPSGRESDINQLTLVMPAKENLGPSIVPSLPGGSFEMIQGLKTMDEVMKNEANGVQTEYDYNLEDLYKKPLMLRNLNAPDLNSKQ